MKVTAWNPETMHNAFLFCAASALAPATFSPFGPAKMSSWCVAS